MMTNAPQEVEKQVSEADAALYKNIAAQLAGGILGGYTSSTGCIPDHATVHKTLYMCWIVVEEMMEKEKGLQTTDDQGSDL